MNKNILVVEDDFKFSSLISAFLEKGGYLSHQAFTMDEALKALEVIEYGAIILDLGLPDCEGEQTFNELKNYARIVPIIVLTGNDSEGEHFIQQGAQDFIRKNIVTKEILLRSVRYSVARKNADLGHNQKIIEVADKLMALWKTTSKDISDLHQFVAGYKR